MGHTERLAVGRAGLAEREDLGPDGTEREHRIRLARCRTVVDLEILHLADGERAEAEIEHRTVVVRAAVGEIAVEHGIGRKGRERRVGVALDETVVARADEVGGGPAADGDEFAELGIRHVPVHRAAIDEIADRPRARVLDHHLHLVEVGRGRGHEIMREPERQRPIGDVGHGDGGIAGRGRVGARARGGHARRGDVGKAERLARHPEFGRGHVGHAPALAGAARCEHFARGGGGGEKSQPDPAGHEVARRVDAELDGAVVDHDLGRGSGGHQRDEAAGENQCAVWSGHDAAFL